MTAEQCTKSLILFMIAHFTKTLCKTWPEAYCNIKHAPCKFVDFQSMPTAIRILHYLKRISSCFLSKEDKWTINVYSRRTCNWGALGKEVSNITETIKLDKKWPLVFKEIILFTYTEMEAVLKVMLIEWQQDIIFS